LGLKIVSVFPINAVGSFTPQTQEIDIQTLWGFFTLAGKITMKDLKPIIVVTYACLVGTIILIIPVYPCL